MGNNFQSLQRTIERMIKMKDKVRRKISIPLGAVLSFVIMIYMLTNNIWNTLSDILKFLAIIGLIILFFMGEIEYERTEVTGDCEG